MPEIRHNATVISVIAISPSFMSDFHDTLFTHRSRHALGMRSLRANSGFSCRALKVSHSNAQRSLVFSLERFSMPLNKDIYRPLKFLYSLGLLHLLILSYEMSR
jgi:hypothetical protein